MKTITGFACALALLAAPAHAEEAHRELGAHVHGHGRLDIGVEGTRVLFELEVPGMDIVGFEHDAKTQDDTAAVEKAKAQLADPLKLFILPAAAGCRLAEAKVALEEEGEDYGHGDEKRESAKEHAHDKGDDDGHEKHGGKDEHAGHTAFHATYAFECAKPQALTTIGFDYFKSFAGAEGLTVGLVTAKGQSSFEVKRGDPELNLGAMM